MSRAPVARLHDISINHVEIRSLKFDAKVQRSVGVFAYRVYRFAFLFAPSRTGHYERSLFVRFAPGTDPRWIVGATDFKSWWIEFGAYNRPHPFPAHAPLRKALFVNRLKYDTRKR